MDSRILSALPHRPPTVLIEEIINSTEFGGVAKSHSKHPLIVHEGKLRTSIFIELMAQAYGYISATHALHSDTTFTPKQALLVGINNFKVIKNQVDKFSGDNLYIKISLVKTLGPLSLINGEILDVENNLLGHGELKLYAN